MDLSFEAGCTEWRRGGGQRVVCGEISVMSTCFGLSKFVRLVDIF